MFYAGFLVICKTNKREAIRAKNKLTGLLDPAVPGSETRATCGQFSPSVPMDQIIGIGSR